MANEFSKEKTFTLKNLPSTIDIVDGRGAGYFMDKKKWTTIFNTLFDKQWVWKNYIEWKIFWIFLSLRKHVHTNTNF